MALEIRPNCECCDVDLAPDAPEAMICTFECTFCRDCVEQVLHNVCPNCGGGFERRPVRPKTAWRPGVSLETRPATTRRVHLRFSLEEIASFLAPIRSVPPLDR